MGKEYDMFDDLFTEDDFSLEDEEQEEPELEMETDPDPELDDEDYPANDESHGPYDDCGVCDPDDDDCDSCKADDSWDTGQRNWDTGGGMRPVPKNVWKPKSWKTF